jgi:hypothetical protein
MATAVGLGGHGHVQQPETLHGQQAVAQAFSSESLGSERGGEALINSLSGGHFHSTSVKQPDLTGYYQHRPVVTAVVLPGNREYREPLGSNRVNRS